jgi:hypothetical protein
MPAGEDAQPENCLVPCRWTRGVVILRQDSCVVPSETRTYDFRISYMSQRATSAGLRNESNPTGLSFLLAIQDPCAGR